MAGKINVVCAINMNTVQGRKRRRGAPKFFEDMEKRTKAEIDNLSILAPS